MADGRSGWVHCVMYSEMFADDEGTDRWPPFLHNATVTTGSLFPHSAIRYACNIRLSQWRDRSEWE